VLLCRAQQLQPQRTSPGMKKMKRLLDEEIKKIIR
jgi:hypothetical protein